MKHLLHGSSPLAIQKHGEAPGLACEVYWGKEPAAVRPAARARLLLATFSAEPAHFSVAMMQTQKNRDWHKSASLTPSLLHGGSRRIEHAHSILEQFELEQLELQKRKSVAQQQFVDTLRDELEDSVSVLQRKQEEVEDFMRRCSIASQSINQAAGEKLNSILKDIDLLRDLLDQKEDEVRNIVTDSLESRLGLLDEQMRTFSVAAPETDQLVRKVQGLLDMADNEELIQNSKPLIAEIERMSDRISRLPSPSDKEPFHHIVLSEFHSVHRSVTSMTVEQLPTVYYIVPCTGNVCGGANVRLEGHNLSGHDVKVWIGGVVCEHATIDSPGGGTTVTCTLPPCQGELEVDVMMEVDGQQAFGDTKFQYSTPAPFVQTSAATLPLSANSPSSVIIPIRGTGFARIAFLNQVEIRKGDDQSGHLGERIPHQIVSAQDQELRVSVFVDHLEPGQSVFASVEVVGVSSGEPVMIGQLGNLDEALLPPPPMPPTRVPHRAAPVSDIGTERHDGDFIESIPIRGSRTGSTKSSRPEPDRYASKQTTFSAGDTIGSSRSVRAKDSWWRAVAASNDSLSGAGITPPKLIGGTDPSGSRVLRTEESFGPGTGQSHFAMQVETMKAWALVGVSLVDGSGDISRQPGEGGGRGWYFQSDGFCFSHVTGDRVDSGVAWGTGDVPGVTVDFDAKTVSFWLNGEFVRSFDGLDASVVVLIELQGASSRASFVDAPPPMPPRAALPPRPRPPPATATATAASPADLATRSASAEGPMRPQLRGRVPSGRASQLSPPLPSHGTGPGGRGSGQEASPGSPHPARSTLVFQSDGRLPTRVGLGASPQVRPRGLRGVAM